MPDIRLVSQMKYAIIAAGEGSRLASEGVAVPKPLVEVNGEKLVDRLIRIFMDNGASRIVVICNDMAKAVAAHLHEVQRIGLGGHNVPLDVVVKTTPSSMHSFFEMREMLADEPFCLTTVDTIFSEKKFSEYITAFIQAAENGMYDGMMGVTDFIDDEKPLYVETDSGLNITGFADKSNTCHLVSAGVYGLMPGSIGVLEDCVARGESRMRNFQRALVESGFRLKAWPLGKVTDIDHASDITKAEEFLKEER